MDKRISIFWLILIVPFSIFIGYLTNAYQYFSIEKGINLVDLFNLIITIFIAYYISFHLQKQTEKNKIEKDFIISKLTPILKDSEILKGFVKNNPNKKKVDENLTSISNALYYSDKFSNICNKNINMGILRDKRLAIKKIITEGKIQNSKYVVEDRGKAIKEIEEFEGELIKQIILINKQ